MANPPAATFFSTTHGTPIFGGADAAPQFTGPFNMNLGNGMFGQMSRMLGPILLQQFMQGTGRTPFQFVPTQGLYDQMVANRYYMDQQQAMGIASRRDQGQIASVLGGIGRLWEGRELTPAELARNTMQAGTVARMLPLAVQMFGPDAVDRMMGSRGSNVVMGQQLHAAMRTAFDPLTGRIGVSGASAGAMSDEIYGRMFGPGGNVGAMRGMSAGQAGLLANELQARGMLGNLGQIGPMTMADLRSRGSTFFDDAFIARTADRDPRIQEIRARGDTPTEEDFRKARNRVTQTRNRALSPDGGLDVAGLAQLPGGDTMLRAGDAHAISQRLESLSGVVAAMREIFGDMGNPHAPMHEIINGLQNLTQGGLSQMSPAALEAMVRRTHAIARQTGLGMQGAIALTTQAAAMGDQFGLHRSFAPLAMQQAALFGAAARDTQRLDIPRWNSMNLDEIVLGDARLRVAGAASPMGNNLNAMLNLANQGIIPGVQPGSAPTQSQAIVAAIQAGASEYTWGGQTRNLQLSRDQLQRLVTSEHGVSSAVVRSIFNDRMGNQQFSEQTMGSLRGLQGIDASGMLGRAYAGPLSEALITAGGMSPNDARTFAAGLGQRLGDSFRNMPADVRRNDAQFRAARVAALRASIRQQVIASGTPAAQVDSRTEQIITGLGGDNGLAAMHGALTASANSATAGTLFRNEEGVANMTSPAGVRALQLQAGQAETNRIIAGSLAGIGTTSVGGRLVDALAGAQPGQDVRGLLADVLGGISNERLAEADPHGIVSAMTNLMVSSSGMNANDPRDRPSLDRNAAIIRGLQMGGRVAQEVHDQYEYDASVSGSTMAALRAAGQGQGGAAILGSFPAAPASGPLADRLIASMPVSAQRKFAGDAGSPGARARAQLTAEITRGNRGGAIQTALRAQDRLVNLALEKGLYGQGTTLDELTSDQRLQAAELLQNARANGQLSPQDSATANTLMRQAGPLQTLGRSGTRGAVDDALRVVRDIGGNASPPGGGGGGGGGNQITNWTGTFTLVGADQIQINAQPANQVSNLVPGP